MFKKMRGCSLSYERQGYIYFTCKNYNKQPKEVKDKIDRLCKEVGGEYAPTLFRILTTNVSVRRAAIEGYISERRLYDLRVEFFGKWEGE